MRGLPGPKWRWLQFFAGILLTPVVGQTVLMQWHNWGTAILVPAVGAIAAFATKRFALGVGLLVGFAVWIGFLLFVLLLAASAMSGPS